MRQIFQSDTRQRQFTEDGYVVVDLLDGLNVDNLWSFYAQAFQTPRTVVPYARQLPYYISIFDSDSAHKREVDQLISRSVGDRLTDLMIDYEVFYSNFMIKFAGDGQIEAHQDFNFVDESRHTAFNLWCPLVDTDAQNGGLYVIAGSHNVFRTQRGPNLPKALTEYNDKLRAYARRVPLKAGQAIIFDHKLIHYSPPNRTAQARVAIQSVLTPREATPVHYVFDAATSKVRAYRINKDFILENNLWEADLSGLELDHEQELLRLPTEEEVTTHLADLTVNQARRLAHGRSRTVFRDDAVQEAFECDGFVKLPVLGREDIERLTELFVRTTGGTVANTEYGMYIGLEDEDLTRKKAVIRQIAGLVLPGLEAHFTGCKPHLGSFLVKAPGADSYTYPHQDWTFVDVPRFASITIWIALVDTSEENGALGFITGSHTFFEQSIGSPSPEFQTSTQGHEALLYEYLQWVPLKAGEAVAFDNRTIHGATPNRTAAPRTAVAIGMTPREAQLYHYFLVPGSLKDGRRTVAKLKVDEAFFERYSVRSLKALFDAGRMPEGCEVAATVEEDFLPFSSDEIRLLCERAGLAKNGRRLQRSETMPGDRTPSPRSKGSLGSALERIWHALVRA
jgi:ectoine hydroxylase-related dioxygenase (phytanoyl-CoA dioxygenase family)